MHQLEDSDILLVAPNFVCVSFDGVLKLCMMIDLFRKEDQSRPKCISHQLILSQFLQQNKKRRDFTCLWLPRYMSHEQQKKTSTEHKLFSMGNIEFHFNECSIRSKI